VLRGLSIAGVFNLENFARGDQFGYVELTFPRSAETDQDWSNEDDARGDRDRAHGNGGAPHDARRAICHNNRVTP
jgi:hypothetical protein